MKLSEELKQLHESGDAGSMVEGLWEMALQLEQENERLKGIKPELPPYIDEGEGLPRYGLSWNGPTVPLTKPMGDGYWTPWHLAIQLEEKIKQLELDVKALKPYRDSHHDLMRHMAEHDAEVIANFISDVAQCTYMALDTDEDYQGDPELVVNFVALQNRANQLRQKAQED